jgi:hypothetical protein
MGDAVQLPTPFERAVGEFEQAVGLMIQLTDRLEQFADRLDRAASPTPLTLVESDKEGDNDA